MFCLSKTINDHLEGKEDKFMNIEHFPLPNLKNLFTTISSNINVDSVIAEDLLMISHGNLEPSINKIKHKYILFNFII